MKKITEIIADVEKKATEPIEGFDWPLDKWYIERFLFLISGATNFIFIFLGIVFHPAFYLVLMFFGAMQILFALTGFSMTVKLLSSFGIKQKSSVMEGA
ncbi:hypothetical protein IPN35_01370 [Candidatus Peregrinibacteria bacterium]|nr:MAG: hypothetical protein IPN35_01370 [Candidatus Peregrinibacteria bacterium]